MCRPPTVSRGRHRKFRVCFYLQCTIAALCFPKLELLLRGNRYVGKNVPKSFDCGGSYRLCYRRGTVVSVCPPPVLPRKSTVLSVSWWVKLSFNFSVKTWRRAYSLTRVPLVGKSCYCVRRLSRCMFCNVLRSQQPLILFSNLSAPFFSVFFLMISVAEINKQSQLPVFTWSNCA